MLLRKKEVFIVITPIPHFIPKQLAIDILHSHSEIIALNPLVVDYKPCEAPRTTKDSDEYYATWYEITQKLQVVPGIGRVGASTIKFNGCFHDLAEGLQTHIYAPMNVELRQKYMVDGNQPGEPPKTLELGLRALNAPADGLFLREDIEIKANIALVGFVKSHLQKAGGQMVQRMIKKAELIDAGALKAMFVNNRLTTFRNISPTLAHFSPTRLQYCPYSPLTSPTQSPGTYYFPGIPRYPLRPGTAGSQCTPVLSYSMPYSPPDNSMMELSGSAVPNAVNDEPVEAEGDYCYDPTAHPSQLPSPALSPGLSVLNSDSSRSSSVPQSMSQYGSSSSVSSSRPTSLSSTLSASGAFQSPGLDHKGFLPDLSTHQETPEEYRVDAMRRLNPARIRDLSEYPRSSAQGYAQSQDQTRTRQRHPQAHQHNKMQSWQG